MSKNFEYAVMSPTEVINFLNCLTPRDLREREIVVDDKELKTMADVQAVINKIEQDVYDNLPFSDCGGECPECDKEKVCRDEVEYMSVPGIKAVTFNDPATIIQWDDGTKTVVKCIKGQKFDQYTGFCAAVCKKLFGTTANAITVMNFFDTNRRAADKQARREREKEEHKKENQKAASGKVEREFKKYLKDVQDEVYKRIVKEAAKRKYDVIHQIASEDSEAADSDVSIEDLIKDLLDNHEVSED